jgi:hypothetical protein
MLSARVGRWRHCLPSAGKGSVVTHESHIFEVDKHLRELDLVYVTAMTTAQAELVFDAHEPYSDLGIEPCRISCVFGIAFYYGMPVVVPVVLKPERTMYSRLRIADLSIPSLSQRDLCLLS